MSEPAEQWNGGRRASTLVAVMLLVPADVLRPRRPDEHFAAEAAAALAVGLDVALVDHDGLGEVGGAERAVGAVPAGAGAAVYRGWMLRSERYADFAAALAERGVHLRTTAEQYRRAHELPGWYPTLSPVSPASVWTASPTRQDFSQACADLGPGPAVLRDYTKSMKHYWSEAVFIPDLADETAAWRVACRFLELREDDFTGGFVLRRFERYPSGEFRTWWTAGDCALTTAHPDTPGEQPPAGLDLTPFASLIESLGLPFVTLDLAYREDGALRVVELGDGQVSDRAVTTPAEALIEAILR